MSESSAITVEATGETVGEAKWAALRELESIVPGLDRDRVQFQVVSEGERGLLGVGFTPANVIASAEPGDAAVELVSDEASAGPREIVERIAAGIAVDVSISARERDGVVTVSCSGPDVALFIGKHGQTIDAIQYLANAIARARRRVRSRRGRGRLPSPPNRDARGARPPNRTACRCNGSPVGARADDADGTKIVHEALKEDPEVETASEGSEPNRFVVVLPRHLAD